MGRSAWRAYTEAATAVEEGAAPEKKKTIEPPTERVNLLVSHYQNLTFSELVFLDKVVALGKRVQMAEEQAKIAAEAPPPPPAAESTPPPAPEAPPAASESAPSGKVGTISDKSASVKLLSFPDGSKINVLKEVRKLKPGMSIVDSKKLVENLPQILVKSATPDEQKEWKTALEAVGAVLDFV